MKCLVCGEQHPIDDMELCFVRPDAIVALSAQARRDRCKESDDLARIDADRWFVRGVIPLNVAGRGRPYRIGAWVEVDRAAFELVVKLWKDETQHLEPPIAATLANEIKSHAGSCGLGAELQLTGPSSRPEIRICDTETPLGAEQARGITEQRALEYTSFIHHG